MRETPVLIVGAGPVGLTLALDLAWRGIDSIVVEQRGPEERATPRANHVSARAMETFRRLGLADDVRKAGLPAAYPPDVAWVTSMTGHELTRIRLKPGDESGEGYADANWPTPEPQHKINQMFLEPILRRRAMDNPRITLLMHTRLDTFEQGGDVASQLTDLATRRRIEIASRFIVGCDGGHSTMRKLIGAAFEGDPALTRVVSLHVRAPDLVSRLAKPAHRYFMVNHVQGGVSVTLDGRELWSFHIMLPTPQSEPADLDRARAIATLTGIDDLKYEIFAEDVWTGRRLLADRFRCGRAFLCGDAAHIWVPNAGYGMNAGIADAENLAWRLAGILQGWGGEGLLDGYARERHPITDQVSRFAKDLAVKNRAAEFRAPPAELSDDTPEGAALRARFGAALYELNLPQFTPLGLNFAYFYDDSPNIVYDGVEAPSYDPGTYTPSTVPGCRAPHILMADGRALYDRLSPDFTLVRTDVSVSVDRLLATARERAVPLEVLDAPEANYERKLTLVRPDRHVAWRGDHQPEDIAALFDRMSGSSG